MISKYQFLLYVQLPNSYERKATAFNVDAYVARESKWEPYDLCSDATTALIAGGVTGGIAERIDLEREKLAKEIAEHLTAHILKSIKAQDTHNGYPQKQ